MQAEMHLAVYGNSRVSLQRLTNRSAVGGVRIRYTQNPFKNMTNNMHGLLILLGKHENRFFQIFLCIKHIFYICVLEVH